MGWLAFSSPSASQPGRRRQWRRARARGFRHYRAGHEEIGEIVRARGARVAQERTARAVDAEEFLHRLQVGRVSVGQGAVVRVALGKRRDHDLGQGELLVVTALGLVVPDHNRAAVLVGGGTCDHRHDHGKEVVALRNRCLIACVMSTVVCKSVRQCGVHVVELIGGDQVVTGDCIVGEVRLQLLQRRIVGGQWVRGGCVYCRRSWR